jgi:hypothetical protein
MHVWSRAKLLLVILGANLLGPKNVDVERSCDNGLVCEFPQGIISVKLRQIICAPKRTFIWSRKRR